MESVDQLQSHFNILEKLPDVRAECFHFGFQSSGDSMFTKDLKGNRGLSAVLPKSKINWDYYTIKLEKTQLQKTKVLYGYKTT